MGCSPAIPDVELSPYAMAVGGEALARHPDGRVVFVHGALPGERVRARITEIRRDFMRGWATEVLDASSGRVTPPCPEIERGCGGCPWQYMAAGAQPALKASVVADALRRVAHLDLAVGVAPERVPPTGYRTTVRMGVDRGGRACYRRRRSEDLVAVGQCLVAHPRLAELIVEGRFPGADQVILRVGARTGTRLAAPTPVSGPRIVVPDDVVVVRRGRSWLDERAAGRRWRISAGSFFQSGPEAAEALVSSVRRAIGDRLVAGTALLDAYCGVGLLGGALVSGVPGARLVAVEANAAAAADARANLADLDARVVTGDVADVTRGRRRVAGPIDVVVADPARRGLGRAAAEGLGSVGAPLIVLVSCDPASLARDAVLLADRGYRLESTEVVEVFPHTFHVETVSRFERTW